MIGSTSWASMTQLLNSQFLAETTLMTTETVKMTSETKASERLRLLSTKSSRLCWTISIRSTTKRWTTIGHLVRSIWLTESLRRSLQTKWLRKVDRAKLLLMESSTICQDRALFPRICNTYRTRKEGYLHLRLRTDRVTLPLRKKSDQIMIRTTLVGRQSQQCGSRRSWRASSGWTK